MRQLFLYGSYALGAVLAIGVFANYLYWLTRPGKAPDDPKVGDATAWHGDSV